MKSNWSKKAAVSNTFDISTGGDRLFVSTPGRNDNWQNWKFDFQLVTEPIGFVQHVFKVVDNTNVPIPEGRDEPPSWMFIPCLGSTGESNEEGEMEMDPEGVAQCQDIIIPGTEVSLHNVEKFEDGRSQTMYRAGIWNWDSECFQILEMKSYCWAPLFDSMNKAMERRAKQDKNFDFHQYTCYAETQEMDGAFPYKYVLDVVPTDHYAWDQVVAKAQEEEHQERFQEMKKHANPLMTAQEIREKIGAVEGDAEPDTGKGHGAQNPLSDLQPESAEIDEIFGNSDEGSESVL